MGGDIHLAEFMGGVERMRIYIRIRCVWASVTLFFKEQAVSEAVVYAAAVLKLAQCFSKHPDYQVYTTLDFVLLC